MGSNAVDGKRLELSLDEYEKLINSHDHIKYIKRYGGIDELLSGRKRYTLIIPGNCVEHAKLNPIIDRKIKECYDYRITAGQDARRAAKKPHAFSRFTFKPGKAMYLPLCL